jgi:BirA family transcriptional regulator, biotin operon repressor / biotin---[acetyl-CoA-carboxylase] ligase
VIDSIIRQHFDTIDSTHSYASGQEHLLKKGDLLLVSAEAQSAGRGRYGHSWTSPRGEGLTVSFGFLIEKQRTDLGNIPQVLALSTTAVLKGYGVTPSLKWPNDLLINKKKIGGILATTHQTHSNECTYVVVSIGLNVAISAEVLETLGRPATSLLVETGRRIPIESVREAILNQFIIDLNQFLITGFSAFFENYRSQMASVAGEKITFHFNNELLEGTFYGITDTGALLLELNGTLTEFVSGELI